MAISKSPLISAVVPTRNRPDHAVPCVGSILSNAGDDFELLIVDQSDDATTERSLAVYAADRRFRYIRSSSRGASAARNVGVEQSTAPIIAFTDDDCRASTDWLQQITMLFEQEPEAALVFGKVSIPDEFKGRGFAAEFEPQQRVHYFHEFPPANVPWGLGANMIARRSLFERVGTFDPLLGPGSAFRAGEEFDLAIRALAAGYEVVHAADIAVLHLGVREGDEASKLVRGYGKATGATIAKHVRMGTRQSKALLSWFTYFAGRGLLNAAMGRRPTGIGFAYGMLAGAYLSLSQPIDRARGIYTNR